MSEQEESFLTPDALDREKAIVMAAVAARAWAEMPQAAGAVPSRDALRRLMHAAAWTTRARAHAGAPALGVAALIDSFAKPVSAWLRGAPEIQLLEEGEPTPFCLELSEEAGHAPLAEVEQRVIVRAMDHLGVNADASGRYAAFRRFLVENATAAQGDAARAARAVGVALSDLYAPILLHAKLDREGADWFYPCPRCNWPMRARRKLVSCAYSLSCLAAGAHFRIERRSLLPLDKMSAPTPRLCADWAALRHGIWRYTTLPGLEEIALAQRLTSLPGVAVDLWPFVDRYDLDVRKAEKQWRIDVKDHVSAVRLARELIEHPPLDPTWIVVPDTRREQAALLDRLVPSAVGYRFAYASEMVRRIGSEA